MTYEIKIDPCFKHRRQGELNSVLAITQSQDIANSYKIDCKEDCPNCRIKVRKRTEEE